MKNPKKHAKSQKAKKEIIKPVVFSGLAILLCQFFETMFVILARSALRYPNATSLNEIPEIKDTFFKQPIKALTKELEDQNYISHELANRICLLIENRNRLVHRLILETIKNGNNIDDYYNLFSQISRTVYIEAGILFKETTEIFLKYVQHFPEIESTSELSSNEINTMFSSIQKIIDKHIIIFSSHIND